MTYENVSQKSISKKVVLAKVRASERLKFWEIDSGTTYRRSVGNFVESVEEDGTELTRAISSTLNSGEFYYDPQSGILYVRMSDDSDPLTKDVYAEYIFFFATQPVNIPFDLSTGEAVHWEARLDSVSSFKHEIDERTNTALEGSGSISFYNNDGFFDSKFDKLFWENKPIEIFSYLPSVGSGDTRKLFLGFVDTKSFTSDRVKFGIKDFLFRLREPVSSEVFRNSDGDIPDSLVGKPKRRLFGRNEIRLVSLDQTLDGFEGLGTIAGLTGTSNVVGSGTSFLTELSPEDEFVIEDFLGTGEEKRLKIDNITSDTSCTVTEELGEGFSPVSYRIDPEVPYKGRNRNWFIASHNLRSPSTTVTNIIADNRIEVASVDDIEAGDIIEINSEKRTVLRVSGSVIVTTSNFNVTINVSDTVTKSPVYSVYFGNKILVQDRDYTIENLSSGSKIVVNQEAEFNITNQINIGNATFTNGSNLVTSTVNFKALGIKSRDYIRSSDLTQPFYEILKVDEFEITLRQNYGGANVTDSTSVKLINYITDESQITCNCLGIESGSEYIKTGSQIIRYLLENDSQLTNINSSTFDVAEIEAPYEMSIALPEEFGASSMPSVRDTITKINSSIFSSVYSDQSQDIAMTVVTAEKPEELQAIGTDDQIKWSVASKSDIFARVVGNYRPIDADRNTGEESFSKYDFDNTFVRRSTQTVNENLDYKVFVYRENDAMALTERYALFHSLANSKVKINGKLSLSIKSVGDIVYVNLRRLFERFGSNSTGKIGRITGISRNGKDSQITVNDYGNMYSRVNAIAPDSTSDWSAASEDDLAKYTFICDNDSEQPTETPTDEESLGVNIIG